MREGKKKKEKRDQGRKEGSGRTCGERRGKRLKREGGDLNVLDTLQEVLDIVHGDNSSW